MKSEILSGFTTFQNSHLQPHTLVIPSKVLSGNPWGDPTTRFYPFLKIKPANRKLVVVLSGFTGIAAKAFSKRFGEASLVEEICTWVSKGIAPATNYLFIDASTFWGGSQFINSSGMGFYEDHIWQEILPLVRDVLGGSVRIALLGGSSGGYGALRLAASHSDDVDFAMAIAPDSFFEANLVADILAAVSCVQSIGGMKKAIKLHREGELLGRRDGHQVLNGIAMAYCYGRIRAGQPVWPVDVRTGKLLASEWRRWKAHDLLEFLPKRAKALKHLNGIYLDVGDMDQFNLHFGARQLSQLLKAKSVRHTYQEFRGTHSEIGSRRKQSLLWLRRRGF